MTLTQRIGRILNALLAVLGVVLMLRIGKEGVRLVSLLLSFSLIILGLRRIVFYFTMARHMVNGRGVLYIGVILLDFGVFTLSVSQNQSLFIVLYLLATHAFSGVMDLMRSAEARRFGAPSWRLKLAEGAVNLVIALAAVFCGLLRGNMEELTLLYAAGLLWSAGEKLVSAFRKTAIVYIQ